MRQTRRRSGKRRRHGAEKKEPDLVEQLAHGCATLPSALEQAFLTSVDGLDFAGLKREYVRVRVRLSELEGRDVLARAVLTADSPSEDRRVRRALNVYMHGRPVVTEKGRPATYPTGFILDEYKKLIAGELLPWCKNGPLDLWAAIEELTKRYSFPNADACLQFLRRARRALKLSPADLPLPGTRV